MKFKEEKNFKKKFKKNELITHKPKNSKKKIKERTKKIKLIPLFCHLKIFVSLIFKTLSLSLSKPP